MGDGGYAACSAGLAALCTWVSRPTALTFPADNTHIPGRQRAVPWFTTTLARNLTQPWTSMVSNGICWNVYTWAESDVFGLIARTVKLGRARQQKRLPTA